MNWYLAPWFSQASPLPKKNQGNSNALPENPSAEALVDIELELELIQPQMAQKPVLRGEVGCACVASRAWVPRNFGPWLAIGKSAGVIIRLRFLPLQLQRPTTNKQQGQLNPLTAGHLRRTRVTARLPRTSTTSTTMIQMTSLALSNPFFCRSGLCRTSTGVRFLGSASAASGTYLMIW